MTFIKKDADTLINLDHAIKIEKKSNRKNRLEITFEYGNEIIELTAFEIDLPPREIIKDRKVEI